MFGVPSKKDLENTLHFISIVFERDIRFQSMREYKKEIFEWSRPRYPDRFDTGGGMKTSNGLNVAQSLLNFVVGTEDGFANEVQRSNGSNETVVRNLFSGVLQTLYTMRIGSYEDKHQPYYEYGILVAEIFEKLDRFDLDGATKALQDAKKLAPKAAKVRKELGSTF